jgi:hypothetical protein
MKQVVVYIALIFSVSACIEPFEFETRDAENVLVVEATITDQLERQNIFLKRASNLEDVNLPPEFFTPGLPPKPKVDLTNYEENAVVVLVDDIGNSFDFIESEPGTYISEVLFAAELGREYQLQVLTAENEIIISDFRGVPGKSEITKVYADRMVNSQGIEGMVIYVDGEDTSGSTDYFRYTYEETYKIIAPKWTSREFKVIEENDFENGELPDIEIVPRAQEEQTCYGFENSSDIILANTQTLQFPQVERKVVRFIDRDNPILSHRYSILVKQFLQSQITFQYYEQLKSFSKSESVFNEIQPGFLEGNLTSTSIGEAVIGYFDVASVSEQRIFFNYVDFFEGEELPPYFFGFNCDRLLSIPLIRVQQCPEPLPIQIRWEIVEFLGFNDPPLALGPNYVPNCPGPYLHTPRICGDCTALGSNVKPDFWID